jgi:hypothetical protein
MVDFTFIRICLGVRLCDTFGNDLGVALLVARKLAIRTLHARCVFEEIPTKGAAHNVVELLLHEFVAILFVNFLFLLSNGTLSAKAKIELFPFLGLFH